MQALHFDDKIQLVDVPKPEPEPGEALIKILYSGICNTDLEILRGYMGYQGILGHEFVGVVEYAENPDLVGNRVVGEINIGCGTCDYCLSGLERHCPVRSTIGIWHKAGAHAEYLTLPERNLCIVPVSVTDTEAVFTEPLAAALEILEQVKIEPNDRVAIVGDGKLGLLVAQVLQLTGADLTLYGKNDKKLAIARSLGIAAVPVPVNFNEKYDLAVEASGVPAGFETAINLVKPRGIVVLKSTYHDNLNHNPAKIVIDEITLIGSRCGRFEPALRLLERRLVRLQPLITKIYSIHDGLEAFKVAEQPDTLKVLINYENNDII